MSEVDLKLEAHLFICTHRRADEDSCSAKNSEQLRATVKAAAQKQFKNRRLRVNASGCLGHCEKGITAVLYPEGKWLTGLRAEDSETCLDLLKNALK